MAKVCHLLSFFVSTLIVFSVSEIMYTNDWAVEVYGGSQDEANRLAARSGFVNLGNVNLFRICELASGRSKTVSRNLDWLFGVFLSLSAP